MHHGLTTTDETANDFLFKPYTDENGTARVEMTALRPDGTTNVWTTSRDAAAADYLRLRAEGYTAFVPASWEAAGWVPALRGVVDPNPARCPHWA